MVTVKRQPRCVKFGMLFFILFGQHSIGAFSTSKITLTSEELGNVSFTEPKRDGVQRNRDGDLTKFPIESDLRRQPSYIIEAHEVLAKGLQDFLGFHPTNNLGAYLKYLVYNHKEPFVDEYGKNIRNYKKVFRFIWEQYNETLVQNYAIQQLNKDKLDLCSVARYLSHQPNVDKRNTLMKRTGDALRYRCHPCTPYTPKQYDETTVLSTDDVNPEGISPEESIILCNGNQKQEQSTFNSTYISELFGSGVLKNSDKSTHLSFDFKPCNYTDGDLVCDLAPVAEVQKVFRQDFKSTLKSFKLILQPFIFKETIIPDYIIGSAQILKLMVRYPDCTCFGNSSLFLQIDPNAFHSTKNYTNKFMVENIDCSLLDLKFLSGFDQLNELVLLDIWNIDYCLPSLPSLPRLKLFEANYCSGFNELYIFPPLTSGLTQVIFSGPKKSHQSYSDPDRLFNDKTVNRIMNWLLISSSNTLEYLAIVNMKRVTKVPSQIPSFKALQKLYLYYNNISTIEPGALAFSAPVLKLSMVGSEIKEIKSGAFQGNFKDAEIFLFSNNLTRLEESVFGPILLQMASGKGFINATENAIDCKEESTCHLSWLKRFDSATYNVTCTNDTKGHYALEPFSLNNCSAILNE